MIMELKRSMKFYLTRIVFFSIFMLLSYVFYAQDTTTIIILHTNDMHSKIDNMPQAAYIIKQFKENNDNVFVFSAGDLFTGNPIVDKYKDPGYPMIDLMNKCGYDISELGNHEFDYGQATLNKRFVQADFPFICANLEVTDSAVLNQPKPFVKFTATDGTTIGVLGLIELEDNGLPASHPAHLDGLVFKNPFQTAKEYENYKDSADIFILLSHLGLDGDLEMARKTSAFDVIIGGHSHSILDSGLWANNTFIVQAGSYFKFLGVLTLKYYNGQLVSLTDSLVNLRDFDKFDVDVKKAVDNYDNNPYFAQKVGETATDIVGKQELGALVTDAMRDTTGCDIAIQNIGGIRIHDLPQGKITLKQVYEMSPFGNTLVEYELNKCQIKRLVKYAYSLEGKNELVVSGMQVELKINPAGKLRRVKLKDCNGNRLKAGKYSVVINDYMSDAYSLPFLKKNFKKTGIVDAEAIIKFIEKKSPLKYQGEKRVKIKK